MLESNIDRKQNHTPVAWLHLIVGAAIPAFDVHNLVLDRNLDTCALYCTDIEEFAVAEERLAILFSRSD